MTEGLSESTADALLSAIFQGVSFSAAGLWAQLHVGPPGSAGTANPAGVTTRVNAAGAFGTDPTGGIITNDAAIGPWVGTAETYTHVSFWTASTSGTFICSGTITAAAATVGVDWSVPVGDLTASFPVAA